MMRSISDCVANTVGDRIGIVTGLLAAHVCVPLHVSQPSSGFVHTTGFATMFRESYYVFMLPAF